MFAKDIAYWDSVARRDARRDSPTADQVWDELSKRQQAAHQAFEAREAEKKAAREAKKDQPKPRQPKDDKRDRNESNRNTNKNGERRDNGSGNNRQKRYKGQAGGQEPQTFVIPEHTLLSFLRECVNLPIIRRKGAKFEVTVKNKHDKNVLADCYVGSFNGIPRSFNQKVKQCTEKHGSYQIIRDQETGRKTPVPNPSFLKKKGPHEGKKWLAQAPVTKAKEKPCLSKPPSEQMEEEEPSEDTD